MAKIQIKSEKLTPFGGIFSIMEKFDSMLSPVIDSTPGKGYYVVNRQKNILLLLDEYSPFKDTLYNSIIRRLSKIGRAHV